jgi:hypothetical protein
MCGFEPQELGAAPSIPAKLHIAVQFNIRSPLMTCIVGLEHNGVVYIGGDAAGVDDSFSISSRAEPKVFRVKDIIIGYTTSFRMGQILQYSFKPPPKPKKKSDLDYLVNNVMDEIRSMFERKGFMSKTKDQDVGGFFLLGYNKKLYLVEEDFQVGRCLDGYDSCGCGSRYALGSMYSTKNEFDPRKRILTALEAASHHNAGVRPPFTIVEL